MYVSMAGPNVWTILSSSYQYICQGWQKTPQDQIRSGPSQFEPSKIRTACVNKVALGIEIQYPDISGWVRIWHQKLETQIRTCIYILKQTQGGASNSPTLQANSHHLPLHHSSMNLHAQASSIFTSQLLALVRGFFPSPVSLSQLIKHNLQPCSHSHSLHRRLLSHHRSTITATRH